MNDDAPLPPRVKSSYEITQELFANAVTAMHDLRDHLKQANDLPRHRHVCRALIDLYEAE